jgi:hypothetical protein
LADDDFVPINASEVSMEIPGSIRRLIGHAIIEFSRLETISEHILWDLLGLQYDDARLLISRIEASKKFQILRDILERRYPDAKTVAPKDSIWRAITVVTEARNKVAHGHWVMVKGRPFILSHRWKGPSDMVMGEPFPYERLVRLIRMSTNLRLNLNEIVRALPTLQPASAPQPSKAEPDPA